MFFASDEGANPKVVLVRPAYSAAIYGDVFGENENDKREIRPPLGLMALAGYLEHHGHACRILDGEPMLWSAEHTIEQVRAARPDIIGITATTPEWPFALSIAAGLRQRLPQATIVFGGAHVTNLPHQSMIEADEVCDYMVLYEGEKAFLGIVNGKADDFVWSGGSDPRMLLAPSRLTGEELSQFEPSRGCIDMTPYRYVDTGVGLVANDAIEAARGCPFGCAFCTSRRTLLAQRDVDAVVREIVRSHKDNGTQLFMFFDDTFTIDRTYATTLFTELGRRKRIGDLDRHVSFYGFTRANTIDFELMELMREVGGDKITIGVETGDAAILQAMQKGTQLDHYREAYAILDELGFTKRASFIVGHPFETEETIRRSIDFALELSLDEIGVNIMTPFPGQVTFRDALAGKGIWFSHDVHYAGSGEPGYEDYGATDWSAYWRSHLRWQNAVVETEELSSAALEYWHRRFLHEVYGSDAMAKRRQAKIDAGITDEYWHRTWRSQAAANSERIAQEALSGAPRFSRPRHLTQTYRPLDLTDMRKSEYYARNRSNKRQRATA